MLQGFVELPGEVQVGIAGVVLWVVSFFLAKLVALLPFLNFLKDFREPLAMAIAAALIGWFQNAVPDAFAAVAVIGVQLVLAILAAFGVGRELKARGVRALQ